MLSIVLHELNFDDLTIPPVTTYPLDYLNGIDEGLAIKRLQVNKFIKHAKEKESHFNVLNVAEREGFEPSTQLPV